MIRNTLCLLLGTDGLITEALLENCPPDSPSAVLILAERIKHDWDFHVVYDFIIRIGSLSADAFRVPALSAGGRTLRPESRLWLWKSSCSSIYFQI